MQVAPLSTAEERRLRSQLAKSKKKTKINLKNIPARDQCQTPPYALLPLLPYIPKEWTIWESAAGQGFMVAALKKLTPNFVYGSSIEQGFDFFKYQPDQFDVQITNVPFSLKYDWLKRTYELNKPFALLMPFDTWAAAKAQRLFQTHGISVILMNRRINFYMPYKKWAGTADFSVAWFCWGLPHLKEPVTYGYLPPLKDLPSWMVKPRSPKEIENS